MVKIVWMVDERASEREEERNQKLLDEKDWAGFFGRYSKLHDRFGSRNLHGKISREVYFGDPGYCDWAVGQEPKVWKLTCFKYVLGKGWRHAGERLEEKRGRRRNWATANLRRGTHERTDERAEELAFGGGPSDTKHMEERQRGDGETGGCSKRRGRCGPTKWTWEENGLNGTVGSGQRVTGAETKEENREGGRSRCQSKEFRRQGNRRKRKSRPERWRV